jgi:hypothetical protein
MKVRSRSDSERVSRSFRPLIFVREITYISHIYIVETAIYRVCCLVTIYRVCCLVTIYRVCCLVQLSRLLPCRRPEEDAINRVSTSSPTPLV